MAYLTHGKRPQRRRTVYAAGMALLILGTCALVWVGLVVTVAWLWGLIA